MLKKIFNIYNYSVFNCFSYFFLSKKIYYIFNNFSFSGLGFSIIFFVKKIFKNNNNNNNNNKSLLYFENIQKYYL